MSPHRAEFSIACDSPEQAAHIVQALEVEARAGPPRTVTTVAAERERVRVSIQADDTRGLRAAVNSYLRWAQTALEVARLARRAPESFKRGPSSRA